MRPELQVKIDRAIKLIKSIKLDKNTKLKAEQIEWLKANFATTRLEGQKNTRTEETTVIED